MVQGEEEEEEEKEENEDSNHIEGALVVNNV
jgi:hypothetical protein